MDTTGFLSPLKQSPGESMKGDERLFFVQNVSHISSVHDSAILALYSKVTPPISINMPTGELFAGETKKYFVLNI